MGPDSNLFWKPYNITHNLRLYNHWLMKFIKVLLLVSHWSEWAYSLNLYFWGQARDRFDSTSVQRLVYGSSLYTNRRRNAHQMSLKGREKPRHNVMPQRNYYCTWILCFVNSWCRIWYIHFPPGPYFSEILIAMLDKRMTCDIRIKLRTRTEMEINIVTVIIKIKNI